MNLKQYLQYKGWTPQRMSEETKRIDIQGVSVSVIYKILKGHVPTLRVSSVIKKVIEGDVYYNVSNTRHDHHGITKHFANGRWRTTEHKDCPSCSAEMELEKGFKLALYAISLSAVIFGVVFILKAL